MASTGVSPLGLHWQQTADGVWKRNIDETEDFYRLLTRKHEGCLPVTGCASFSITNSDETPRDLDKDRVEAALREGWTTLRFKHPTLGSHIEHDTKRDCWTRICPALNDEDELQRWLDSTFRVIDTTKGAVHWFNNDAPAFSAPTVYLVREQAAGVVHSTVFLRCPHDITDGVGILLLLNQLFDEAGRAYTQREKSNHSGWRKEQSAPSPCLRIAAAIPSTLSNGQAERWADVKARNGAVYTHPHLLSLPASCVPSATAEICIQRISLSLPEVVSKQILHAGKAVAPGVSVTHVFTSALALALAELQPREDETYPVRYVNHSMINLRPYCHAPYTSPAHAAAPYHTISAQALGIDLVVPGASTDSQSSSKLKVFSFTAIKVRDFYNAIRPMSGEEPHEQVYLAPLVFKSMTPAAGTDPHAASHPPFCPVALSSIGNIATMVAAQHGPFQLVNVWASSEPIGAGVALFLGGWAGKLDLSAVFDTRYHGPEYVQKFLERILSGVRTGLGVGERQTVMECDAAKTTEGKKRKLDDVEMQSQKREPSSPLQERSSLANVLGTSSASSKDTRESRPKTKEIKRTKTEPQQRS